MPGSGVVLDSFHDFELFIVSHTWIYSLLVLVWLFMFETEEMSFKKSNGSLVDHQDNISYLNDVNELNVNDSNLMGGFFDILLPPIVGNTLLNITIIMMVLLQIKLFIGWFAHEDPHEQIPNFVDVGWPFSLKAYPKSQSGWGFSHSL